MKKLLLFLLFVPLVGIGQDPYEQYITKEDVEKNIDVIKSYIVKINSLSENVNQLNKRIEKKEKTRKNKRLKKKIKEQIDEIEINLRNFQDSTNTYLIEKKLAKSYDYHFILWDDGSVRFISDKPYSYPIVQHSIYKAFFRNGNLEYKMQEKSDTAWWENGNIRFVRSSETELAQFWFENGSKQSEFQFKGDLNINIPPWKATYHIPITYPTDPNPPSSHYTGFYKKWHMDGSLLLHYIYTKGNITTEYDENGNIHTGLLTLQDGSTEHYKNGNLQQVDRDSVLNGVDIGFTSIRYYENGNTRQYDFHYKNNNNVLRKSWYENGQLKLEGTYVYENEESTMDDGKKSGVWKEWYENGQLKEEGNWDDGTPKGLFKIYYENGQLKLEENYIDGEKDAVWIKEYDWYENGQLKFKCYFERGKYSYEKLAKYQHPRNKDKLRWHYKEALDGKKKKVLYEYNGLSQSQERAQTEERLGHDCIFLEEPFAGIAVLERKGWYENGQLEYQEVMRTKKIEGIPELTYADKWKGSEWVLVILGPEIEEITYKRWNRYGVCTFNESNKIGNVNIQDVDEYNIEEFVDVFLKDCKSNGIRVSKQNIQCKFEFLPDPIIALSYSMNHNSKITIEVDPEKWDEADLPTKWYIIYHELGHDVLNLEHGHGGKMMFPIADDSYDWDEFFEDKLSMFNYYKTKK